MELAVAKVNSWKSDQSISQVLQYIQTLGLNNEEVRLVFEEVEDDWTWDVTNDTILKKQVSIETHKAIVATYSSISETIFAVPIEWKLEDVVIKYDCIYYKGIEQFHLQKVINESDKKYPADIIEDDLEIYFDC